MKLAILILTLSVSATWLQAAQLYRWVDEKGRVEWRDTPPPDSAKKFEQRNVGRNTIETTSIPYGVQQAVKNFPVTLWAYDCGGPCEEARAHLARRGVPHTEKNAQTNNAEFIKATGGSKNVPVLFVGTWHDYYATSMIAQFHILQHRGIDSGLRMADTTRSGYVSALPHRLPAAPSRRRRSAAVDRPHELAAAARRHPEVSPDGWRSFVEQAGRARRP